MAYDGSGFSGFQAQDGSKQRTVQGVLEGVLSQRLNTAIRVVAAGRTDAGVHARGQAIHFDVPFVVEDLEKVQTSVDKMLPTDVALWNLQPAPAKVRKEVNNVWGEYAWNVMYDNTAKLYSYQLAVGPVMHPIDRHTRWHPDYVDQWLDVNQLRQVLQVYVGTHDFRALAGAVDHLEQRSGTKVDTRRTVYKVDLVDEGNDYYRIDIQLKGALYKQVRNMVGTALDVCRGNRLDVDGLRQLLQDGPSRRANKSKPAPPQGLTLEMVYFDNDDDF